MIAFIASLSMVKSVLEPFVYHLSSYFLRFLVMFILTIRQDIFYIRKILIGLITICEIDICLDESNHSQ